MKNSHRILNPSRVILWLAGCTNHDEPSSPPSQPRRDPDAIGCDPALFDGYPHDRVHVLPEFLFMGCIRKWIVPGLHRRGDVVEDEERVINFLDVLLFGFCKCEIFLNQTVTWSVCPVTVWFIVHELF